MTDAWIEMGSSLVGVTIAAGLLFLTPWGRRFSALTRRWLGSGARPTHVALALGTGTLAGTVLVEWLLGAGPPKWYGVTSGLILAVGAGAMGHAITRTTSEDG